MEPKGDAAPLFQHIDVHESNKVPGPSAHLKLATPLQVKLACSNLKVRLPCNPPTQPALYAGRPVAPCLCRLGCPAAPRAWVRCLLVRVSVLCAMRAVPLQVELSHRAGPETPRGMHPDTAQSGMSRCAWLCGASALKAMLV